MIDDRTPLLDLPLPNVDNLQTEDIPRLRSALGALDTAVAAKADLVAGKVPAAQLPAYVDDVVEYANFAALPATGASGVIYVTTNTTPVRQWRWSGSAYSEIAPYYTLPSATPSLLGGVKVGSGLTVTPEGVLSTVDGAPGSGLPVFGELTLTPASNGQTVFTPAGGYSAGQIELFLNGVLLLGNGDDYTASNGTTITLTVGANTTDTLFLRRWIYLPEAQAMAKTGDTMTGALNWAAPVSVASAATCNIGLAASNLVTVTGATTITSLGVVAAGVQRTVVFDGALTLTHSAALILPGAANIPTAAGDAAVFQSMGGGSWRCTGYQKATGVDAGSAIGDIITAESAPGGAWLPCDGSIYLQSAYPSLFAKLGTRWQNYYGRTTAGGTLPKAPRAVKWLNGQFVAVSDVTSDTTQFYTSADGSTWTGRTAPQLNLWQDVAYGDGYYVAISGGVGANRAARSAGGVTWVSATGAPDANDWSSIAHGGGVFVAVCPGGTNRVTRSTNAGANWTSVSVPARGWYKVFWTGTKFVAFASGYSMSSSDGSTWVESALTGLGGAELSLPYVVWTGKEFVAKTSEGTLSLAVSPDGINFSYLQSGPPLNLVTSFSKILYANKTLFVSTTVSTGGIKLFITHDLQNWASSWERDSSSAFSGELAMSDGGLFMSANSALTWTRACGYNTATQFVVPAIGPKAYIKAE